MTTPTTVRVTVESTEHGILKPHVPHGALPIVAPKRFVGPPKIAGI